MAIAKMALVSIAGDLGQLDDVIMQCLGSGAFHPEPPLQAAGGIRGFTPLAEENPYGPLLAKITDAGVAAGLTPHYDPGAAGEALQARYCEDFCSAFREKATALRERQNYLHSEIEQDESGLVILSHLAELDVAFDDLFSCKYTKVRFGRLPLDGVRKLEYYAERPFIFKSFDIEGDYQWGAYFVLTENAPEIDDLFLSLYFERVRVPEFIHGTPEAALERLREQIARNRDALAQTKKQLADVVGENNAEFTRIYSRIRFLSDSFELRRFVSVLRREYIDVFYLTGFIEQDRAAAFAAGIKKLDGVDVEIRPHDSDKRLKAPTKLKNGWFAKPFELFVEMYGVPAYGDPDPTPFVAITYCLLFGAMFGDLGQGLLLVIGGWLFWRMKGAVLGRIINRIGIFSCIFGAFYGSVFGFEELLTPFYTQVLGLPGKPIEVMAPENTNLVLLTAVALGVALICISILIGIWTGFRRHDYERAVFSANGIAGLLFYGSILFGAAMLFITGKNLFTPLYVVPLIVLPLAAILFKEPLGKIVRHMAARPAEGMGAYLTEGAFELFEVVLSFFSNTMSFLRVGGFVLSHAGMMAVVFTLSEMVSGAASPIVIVAGNLFVIGMEGLIVGIQVLRLEFYELFSRYFDGDGKPFVPAAVTPDESK